MSSLGDLLLGKTHDRSASPPVNEANIKREHSPVDNKGEKRRRRSPSENSSYQNDAHKVFPDRVEKNDVKEEDSRSNTSSTDDYVRELLDPNDRPRNVWHVVEGPKKKSNEYGDEYTSNDDATQQSGRNYSRDGSDERDDNEANIHGNGGTDHRSPKGDRSQVEAEDMDREYERSSDRDAHRKMGQEDEERDVDGDRHQGRHRDQRQLEADTEARDREGSERHKDRDRDGDGHRHKHRDRDRDRDRERDRGRDRDRDRDRDSDRNRDRDRDRDRGLDSDKRRSHRSSRRRHDYSDDDYVDDDRGRRYSSRHRGSKHRSRSRSQSRRHSRSSSRSPTATKRNSRTVLVMQLAPRVATRDLEEYFSDIGDVREVRLIMDSKTRRHKGIAYIEFEDASSANKALAYDGKKFLGVPMQIQSVPLDRGKSDWHHSSSSTSHHHHHHHSSTLNPPPHTSSRMALPPNSYRIYMGGLHVGITEEMLRTIVEPFGPILRLELIKDRATGASRGYAFVLFANIDDGQEAVRNLDGFELAGKNLRVSKSTEKTDH